MKKETFYNQSRKVKNQLFSQSNLENSSKSICGPNFIFKSQLWIQDQDY